MAASEPQVTPDVSFYAKMFDLLIKYVVMVVQFVCTHAHTYTHIRTPTPTRATMRTYSTHAHTSACKQIHIHVLHSTQAQLQSIRKSKQNVTPHYRYDDWRGVMAAKDIAAEAGIEFDTELAERVEAYLADAKERSYHQGGVSCALRSPPLSTRLLTVTPFLRFSETIVACCKCVTVECSPR